ncbi:MAG: hypothetical protein K2M04_05355 [Muribaculaceae bacterium]|nr:hypothetical protein [Muribaculaceae bacterium]
MQSDSPIRTLCQPVVTEVITLSPSAHNRIIMSRCLGRIIWPVVGVMALVALAAWWKSEINWYFLIPIVGLIMLPSLMLAAFMTQTLSREAAESIRPHRFEFSDDRILVIPIKEKPSELTASDESQDPEFPDTRRTYEIPVSEVTDIELTGEYLMVKLKGPLSRFILVPHQSLSRNDSRRLIAFMRALTEKPDETDADW